uniref:Transposase n=1 Tax=Triticum aestivum TaxID=4565 RepID=A0A3B6LIV9_WHEAT
MNTDSETIKTACKDILQKNSKNRRHQIKKKYFDTIATNKVSIKSPVPDLTDGEWQALVEMWSTPRHKETCVSNKMNREKVVYNQRTGSRHYTTHIFAIKEERKGEELSTIDLLKATHNSKKHGFSEPVKTAI